MDLEKIIENIKKSKEWNIKQLRINMSHKEKYPNRKLLLHSRDKRINVLTARIQVYTHILKLLEE